MTIVSQTTRQQELTSTSQTRDTLVIWYHQTDHALLATLDPHLQVLVLRLNNAFKLHYYSSPKSIPQPPAEDDGDYTRECKEREVKDYQGKYAKVLQGLAHAALFLPCISPTFLLQFWKDCERDPQLRAQVIQPVFPVLPLPLRPMAGVAHAALPKPLTAYGEGHERETACATIASTIDALLREYYQPPERPAAAPFRLLEAPHHNKRSFFQWFTGRSAL